MISKDIKLLTLATSVRWFGWGLVEMVIPVFLFSLTKNNSETGILSSMVNIAFFISIPFISSLVDRVSSKIIILIGIALYPLVGLSYFLSGITGLIFFVFIARIINGITYGMDCVGRATYIRRHSAKKDISSTFGYLEAISNFWWLAAAILSLTFIDKVPLHYVFLMIIPTSIIAFFIIKKTRRTNKEKILKSLKVTIKKNPLKEIFNETLSWNKNLKIFASLSFFSGFIYAIQDFFIPLYVFQNEGSISKVIIITTIMYLPTLLDFKLGKLGDKNGKSAVIIGLVILAASLILLGLSQNFLIKILLGLIIGMAVSLIHLTCSGITTRLTKVDHYGKMEGIMQLLGSLGGILGPIILGLSMDSIGSIQTFFFLSIAILPLTFLVQKTKVPCRK